MTTIKDHMAQIGSKGGKAKTDRKSKAARANGRKGGRPKNKSHFAAGFQHAENLVRSALRGHSDSELWGENGLLAATMRCVDAVQDENKSNP